LRRRALLRLILLAAAMAPLLRAAAAEDPLPSWNEGPAKARIIAFDGALQMLEWTTAGPGPGFAMLIHHTDAAREWAYDRNSPVGRLDKALDAAAAHGWEVVDMKADWRTIYP
jgi:hypothetical protein